MEPEVRYYLAGKKSWSDVTTAVTRRNTPKKGDVVNVGKVRMTVQDVVPATLHGRTITKVLLEDTGIPYTMIDEAIDALEDPILIEIGDTEEVSEAKVRNKVGGHPSDTRTVIGNATWSDSAPRPIQANSFGSPGTLGGYFRSGLSNLGQGYGVSVSDFGEAITITVTYSNAASCAMASLNFVVIYRGKNTKNAYTVYANNARYRNCSDYGSAISFIRSKASVLSGRTSAV